MFHSSVLLLAVLALFSFCQFCVAPHPDQANWTPLPPPYIRSVHNLGDMNGFHFCLDPARRDPPFIWSRIHAHSCKQNSSAGFYKDQQWTGVNANGQSGSGASAYGNLRLKAFDNGIIDGYCLVAIVPKGVYSCGGNTASHDCTFHGVLCERLDNGAYVNNVYYSEELGYTTGTHEVFGVFTYNPVSYEIRVKINGYNGNNCMRMSSELFDSRSDHFKIRTLFITPCADVESDELKQWEFITN